MAKRSQTPNFTPQRTKPNVSRRNEITKITTEIKIETWRNKPMKQKLVFWKDFFKWTNLYLDWGKKTEHSNK